MRLFLALLCLLAGGASAQTRPAIIDTSADTRPFIADLRRAGVQVVARYLARCPQPEIPGLEGKRLIDQGDARDPRSEVSQLLAAGIAVLSVYQYYNASPDKLSGAYKGKPLPGADCRPSGAGRNAREEARLDATAAVDQARALGQPRGTAIYFGMDFDYAPASDGGAVEARIIDYFTEINASLRGAGYSVGVYGNGYVIDLLRSRQLAEFGWISASAAFHQTSRYFNAGQWTLFQHEVDTEWFGTPAGTGCSLGLKLDANVQNPVARDAGFWNARGPFALPPATNATIAADRRFVCNGNAVVRRAATSKHTDLTDARACRNRKHEAIKPVAGYGYSVVAGRTEGKLIEVDIDDDGRMDGWTRPENLTRDFTTKPEWIGAKAAREAETCP